MSLRMKLTKRVAARRLRRSVLQQAPGLGLPADVVSATMVDMRIRGVPTSTIAEVFKTTTRAVRQVLERHRLAARSTRFETASTETGADG